MRKNKGGKPSFSYAKKGENLLDNAPIMAYYKSTPIKAGKEVSHGD
nr:MAG TPA: hypothetical protein [Caudoviricetes sp.]